MTKFGETKNGNIFGKWGEVAQLTTTIDFWGLCQTHSAKVAKKIEEISVQIDNQQNLINFKIWMMDQSSSVKHRPQSSCGSYIQVSWNRKMREAERTKTHVNFGT